MLAWLLYTVLLVLNMLDYATTHALLAHFRDIEEWGPAPPWKRTRLGKWCIKHGLTPPAEPRRVEWWEHEINPLAQWLLRTTDFFGLAVMKGVALGLVAASVALNPLVSGVWGWAVLVFMIDVYVLVVANNVGVMMRCRLAPFVGPTD